MTDKVEFVELFSVVLTEEMNLSRLEAELREETNRFKRRIAEANARLEKAWAEMESAMKKAGKESIRLPDSIDDYLVSYSTPAQKVKVLDVGAIPEAYVKIEKTPKLREIGAFLKSCAENKIPLPNWAGFERGEPKLQWRRVKKKYDGSE